MDYKLVEKQIVERLDVRAEYEKLGVEFVGRERDSGYIECKAWGRNDTNASACVNLKTGHYKDSGGENKEITLWQFAADTGRFADWKAARDYYAQRAQADIGPAPEPAQPHCTFCHKEGHWRNECTELKAAQDWKQDVVRLKFVPDPATEDSNRILTLLRNWVTMWKKCTVITPEGMRKAGALIGTKQYDDRVVDQVIGWQSINCDRESHGAIMVAQDAPKIKVRKGDDDGCYAKCQSVGEAGLVGAYAIHQLFEAETAPIILKCEGLSDMLAAYSKMPKLYDANEDVVWPVTNQNGATESVIPYLKVLQRARYVIICHDCDNPGVKGATTWATDLHKAGIRSKVVVLPYPVEEKHGKDLRDYFAEGNTWGDFMSLVGATKFWEPPVEEPPPPPMPPGQAPPPQAPPVDNNGGENFAEHPNLLQRCGISVLGYYEDKSVHCYSTRNKEMTLMKEVDGTTYNEYALLFGDVIYDCVKERHVDEDGDPRPSLKVLKQAITRAGNKRRLDSDNIISTGVWLQGEDFILVNGNSAWKFDKENQLTELEVPFFMDQMIKLKGKPCNWFEPAELKADIELLIKNPAMVTQTADAVFNMFDMFNFKARDEEQRHKWSRLYTGVCGAIILQTAWTWRPVISVIGESGGGKTELIARTLRLLTQFNSKGQGILAYKIEGPTQAAIRQEFEGPGRGLIIDEFEKCEHRQAIYEMFRTFSSGSTTIRGSSNQIAKSFHLKIMPLLASIESGISSMADDNRRISFEVLKPHLTMAEYQRKLPADYTRMERLFRAAVLVRARRALEIETALRNTVLDINQRRKDTYSACVAMVAALWDWTIDQAVEFLVDLVTWIEDQTDMDLKNDSTRIVQTMLDRQLRESHGKITSLRTIFEKFRENYPQPYEPSPDEMDMMNRYGFRVTTKGSVAIIPPRIKDVFRGTDQAGLRVKEILMRIPGAKYQATVWYASSSQQKSVVIPMQNFLAISNPDECDKGAPVPF